MKKLFILFALLALVKLGYAQQVTPNLNLRIQPPSSRNWGLTLNSDLVLVDSAFSSGQCGDGTHALGFNATTRQLFCNSIPGTGITLLPIANGGTGTATPGLIAGSNIIITGAWPNQTINASGGGSGSPAFGVITAGTNTSALLIGTGGSLGVTGSGTIDSTTLLGGTWAVPGAIGITTPNSGAFTSLSSTTSGTFNNLTVTGVCTGCSGTTTAFASVTAGTNTAALVVGTGGSLAATGTGTITATNFLGLTAGTSGGIPYFSGASTLASSAMLIAGLPVVGGGIGAAPVSGTRTGNTTQFATWTGATTASRCIDTDANGNLHVTASDCNVGAVTSVGETFTGGIISVSGSPITTSGTFALTVAGVSGGIPYFSSGSAWASSAVLTANALMKGGGIALAPSTSAVTEASGVIATNADLVSIAPSATNTNGALSVAPTATGTPAAIFNCASGVTVNCLSIRIGGVDQVVFDSNGKTNLQPSTLTSASFNINPTGAALPSGPVAGDVALVASTLTYFDSTAAEQDIAANNISTIFLQPQGVVSPSGATVPFFLRHAVTPTVDLFQCQDSTGAVTCSIAKDFGFIAPYFKTNSANAGQMGFGAGTNQGLIPNQVSISGPPTLTGAGYDVSLPGVEPTAGQVLTIGTCTSHLCNSSYTTPGGGGGGTVTSVAQSFTGGLISVAGSPITGAGTLALTVAGTSGGVPYFSAASTWASSGALTANLPVIGGGAGAAPTVGTRTGNTTQFASWTGATTASRCIHTDASGNLTIASADCGTGGSGSPAGPNYIQAFTTQTSITMAGTSHNLGSKNLILACYNTASPAAGIQPASWTVDSTSFDVVVNFASSQSGYCVLNGTGPAAKYSATFTSQTSLVVTGATHNLGTADLAVTIYDSATGTRKQIEPASVSIDSTTFNVTVAFNTSQSGRIIIQ